MSAVVTKNQSANEVLDYKFNWTPELSSSELISSSIWSTDLQQPLPPSIAPDGKSTVVWLGSGQEGRIYDVFNRVTTNQNRILEQGFRVEITRQYVST